MNSLLSSNHHKKPKKKTEKKEEKKDKKDDKKGGKPDETAEERAARKDPHAQQSLQQVRADLARLTEQLKVDVPRHEQRFGARFLYRGVPYLDTLLSESDPAVDPNLRTPASNN